MTLSDLIWLVLDRRGWYLDDVLELSIPQMIFACSDGSSGSMEQGMSVAEFHRRRGELKR